MTAMDRLNRSAWILVLPVGFAVAAAAWLGRAKRPGDLDGLNE